MVRVGEAEVGEPAGQSGGGERMFEIQDLFREGERIADMEDWVIGDLLLGGF